MPWNSEVTLVEMKGQTILDMLEMGAHLYPEECGGFIHCSGMEYSIDSTIPSSVEINSDGEFVSVNGEYRVKNVTIGGNPLDLEKDYTVAINRYYSEEYGDGMTMFKDATMIKGYAEDGLPYYDHDVVIAYLQSFEGGKVPEEYADPNGQGRLTVITEEDTAAEEEMEAERAAVESTAQDPEKTPAEKIVFSRPIKLRTTDGCNVRVLPEQTSNIIETVAADTELLATKEEGDWYKVVSENGTAGYVNKNMVIVISPESVVKVSSLLRKLFGGYKDWEEWADWEGSDNERLIETEEIEEETQAWSWISTEPAPEPETEKEIFYDFKTLRCGDTEETVLEVEGDNYDYSGDMDALDAYYIAYDTTVAGLDAVLAYYFSDDKGSALSYGYLTYDTWYMLPRTSITMSMSADNYDVSTTITYQSMTISPGDPDYSDDF